MIEKLNTGFVLEKRVFEDEHIVRILTEGGNIIALKAKGLDSFTSKNRMSLNILNKVEVEYFTSPTTKSNTGRLKTARALKEFTSLNDKTLDIVEVTRNILLDSNSNTTISYKILEKIIFAMESNNFRFQNVWELMVYTMRINGYIPIVDRCAKCGTTQDIKGFSLFEGGLICKNHEEANKYSMKGSTLRKIIEIHILKDPSMCNDLELTPEEEKNIKSMYKQFMEQHMGVNLFVIDRI